MPARLAEARRRAGLSQNALAKAAGVAQPTILRLENGTSYPTLDTLEQVAMALRVSPCWLAFGAGEREEG